MLTTVTTSAISAVASLELDDPLALGQPLHRQQVEWIRGLIDSLGHLGRCLVLVAAPQQEDPARAFVALPRLVTGDVLAVGEQHLERSFPRGALDDRTHGNAGDPPFWIVLGRQRTTALDRRAADDLPDEIRRASW